MEDLRVIKTKESIKGAFIELVEERGFQHVSVKDICEKARINRNTFYLHYLDKIDLLNKMVRTIFIEQEKDIIKLEEEKSNDFKTIKKRFKKILDVFYEEIEFYRVILLDSNTSGHVDKYISTLITELAKIHNIDYKTNRVQIDYMFYGIVGVIKNWIIKDYKSIEELSTILANITINTIFLLDK